MRLPIFPLAVISLVNDIFKHALVGMSAHSSPGPGGLPICLLRSLSNAALLRLAVAFRNIYLGVEDYPQDWTSMTVYLLPKTVLAPEPKHYRPLTVAH
eukprot:44993-Amphidinium_carterae.1